MRVEEIDKNLIQQKACKEDGVRYFSIPDATFALYGVYYDETEGCFQRMDKKAAENVNELTAILSSRTSGGRLCFSTDAKTFVLKATYDGLVRFSQMPLLSQCGFVLLQETERGYVNVKSMFPTYADEKGFAASVNLSGERRNYILYFPLYNAINTLFVGVNDGATVTPYLPYRTVKPILYYGSSITQGGCASRADNSYQAMISKWNKIDFINLGFSGNAKGEDAIADYLGGIDCSLFVCDYDHNAPTAEHLQRTHFRVYERFRKAQPNTPILFISCPDDTLDVDGKRRKIIQSTVKRAKAQGDNNVWFLDGRTLLGKKDRDFCRVDSCHPNDLGFYRMAKTIYKKMIRIDEIFR